MNSKDYSVKVVFLKLSFQMEDHNSDSKFRNFAQDWGFQYIQSSPYHLQSNGEAEKFVRTVKNTFTKAHQSGQNPNMALLCYRSTPINSKLPSPAELINSRLYRTLLPI